VRIIPRSATSTVLLKGGEPPTNNPPVWDSQPLIYFSEGISSDYNMNDITSDPDSDPITFSMNTGTVALPTGVTWTAFTGILAYNGIAGPDVTSGHIITLDDGEDTTDSNAFNITIAPEGSAFPRVGSLRHNSRVYGEDNSDGEYDREHIAAHDGVMLGMFYNGPWDSSSAADYPGDPGGTNGWLSRDAIVDDLLTRNPNLIIYDYVNVMESGLTGASQIKADFLDSMTGPNGSDGWVYKPIAFTTQTFTDANKYSTWPNTYNTNITEYAVGPAPDYFSYPEWFATFVKEKHMDPIISNPGKVHIYFDVVLNRPKKAGTDMDGNEDEDDCNNHWDPLDSEHVAHNGGQSVELSRQWRQGQADCINKVKSYQSDLLITVETPGNNFGGWPRGYNSVDPEDAPAMMTEYVDLVHGGFMTGQTGDQGLWPEGSWPISGIANNGEKALNQDATAGFRAALNAYTYIMDNTMDPKHVFNDWGCVLTPYLDPRHPSPEGNTIETSEPTGAGTAWNCFRVGSCMTLLDNGLISIVGKPGGNGNSSPWFDEFGFHNTGTTGLSPKWLGQAVDGVQRTARQGSNIFIREFDNGWVVVNSDLDGSATSIDISVFGSPGSVKRINGVQDPSHNDGSTVTEDFDLDPIDGIWLEKV